MLIQDANTQMAQMRDSKQGNSFGSRATLDVDGKKFEIFRLDALERAGVGQISRLPFSLKVLLENLLRNEDGRFVRPEDIEALAQWGPPQRGKTREEIEQLAQQGDMKSLEAYLLPVDTAVQHWPVLNVSEAAAYYLQRGQAIIIPHKLANQECVRLVINPSRFLGVGEVLSDGKIAPRRLVTSK